jgi:predicted PurR-regulated permease PerM
MATRTRRQLRIDVTAATFFRALGVIVLVWLWWLLWQWVVIFLLGVFVAIALDPLMLWLERHGLRRAYAAPLFMLMVVIVIFGFLIASGASLAAQANLMGERLEAFRQWVISIIPSGFGDLLFGSSSSAQPAAAEPAGSGASRPSSSPSFSPSSGLSGLASTFSGVVSGTAGALASGVTGFAVVLVVTVYLLIDGRRTYAWLAAFAPPSSRGEVEETACRARDIVAAYIRGNLITSALSAVCTWIVLVALGVPAALLLALLAGVMDLLPVIGFVLSAVPAVLLGLTVSGSVGLAVAGFFVLYNVVENYYIQPKVYGRQMQLSDLAVIAAFLVGAELGGVLGALVALPIAAMYPVFEDLWLRRRGNGGMADEHRRIESQPEH